MNGFFSNKNMIAKSKNGIKINNIYLRIQFYQASRLINKPIKFEKIWKIWRVRAL